MDRKRLGAALDELLTAYPSSDAHISIMVHLNPAETGALNTNPRILNSFQALRADAELGDFDGLMEIVPGGANRLEYKKGTDWPVNVQKITDSKLPLRHQKWCGM